MCSSLLYSKDIGKFLSSFFSSLVALFPQLPISPLCFFHFFFPLLSCIEIATSKSVRIKSPGGIRWKSCLPNKVNWVVDGRILPNIEISLTIEIHVTHVGTIDVTDLHSILCYLSLQIVLSFLFDRTNLIKTIKIVSFVMEFNFACKLMTHCAKEDIIELITLVIPFNPLPIMESNNFVPIYLESS